MHYLVISAAKEEGGGSVGVINVVLCCLQATVRRRNGCKHLDFISVPSGVCSAPR